MTALAYALVLVVGVPLAALVGYFVIGEIILGWFFRMGTQHIRPRSPRRSEP